VANSEFEYEIPALVPMIEILDVGFKPTFGDIVDIDNLTVRVSNSWMFPINSQWAKIIIDGEEVALLLAKPNVELIESQESVEITYDLSFISSTKGSRVTIEVELGATRTSRTFDVT